MPKFNAVSKPNEWSQSVADAIGAIRDADHAGGIFEGAERKAGGPVSGDRMEQPQSWMHYETGRSRVKGGGATNSVKNNFRAEI